MTAAEWVHLIIAGVPLIATLVWWNIQASQRLENAKLSSEIRVHIAADHEKHDAIDEHFVATDRRVDRIENRVYMGGSK